MNKYILVNSGENLEGKLHPVSLGTQLVLRPGPKCIALKLTCQTDLPSDGSKFVRYKYRQLPITSDHCGSISSNFNWHVSVKLNLAGTFHFRFLSEDDVIWSAYIVVEPDIKIPLDAIRCQTVLSKNLGVFSEWRKRLTLARDSGYNMIHFTPIQELGASNSAYAIRDQHKLNPTFKASMDDIRKEVEFMKKKWGLMSVTDIVLNHTADDSQWIRDNPECSYNLSNSPHLRPAFLLDSAFLWLQSDLVAGNLERTDNVTASIRTDEDVKIIATLLSTFYVPMMKIFEFFLVDIDDALARIDKIPRGDSLQIQETYQRFKAKVVQLPESVESREDLKDLLLAENLRIKNEIKGKLNEAVRNAVNAIRYERLDPKGPYYQQDVSQSKPLVAPYFSHSMDFRINREEELMYSRGHLFMAHNGWVMGGTSTEANFNDPKCDVLLKRQLIAWGDCIKLRYGSGPKEVPVLWERMHKYVKAQAKIFHGFRIDNCHSTPIHVAQSIIDEARSVRPDIYIMAELFTNSEEMDNEFVNKLGITALIRESMSAHNCRELGRLMYRFGGTPVGAFYHEADEPLRPATARAMFYDQTHDNESMIVQRSAHDLAATTAIISMANCATGSSRGYDELVPHHINVVTESRLYPLNVDENLGILPLRRLLNTFLREELKSFSEIFVDQVNEDVLAITRHNPGDGRSIILIARTAFSKDSRPCPLARGISIRGKVNRILFEAQCYGDPNKFQQDDSFINGLADFKTKIFNKECSPAESTLASIENLCEDRAEIHLNEFCFLPSSVLALEAVLSERQSEAIKSLNSWSIGSAVNSLTLADVNYVLFRCQQEEGAGPYALPNFCTFTYCGLYGLVYYLDKVRANQDQAHPLAMNLREGSWLANYIVARLKSRPQLGELADKLESAFAMLELLPRGMVPKFFDLIVTRFYNSVLNLVYSKMSTYISQGPKFVKLLALSSVALIGQCESAPMPKVEPAPPSMAAGLPHFASGFMRNWGRDTFISLRGLLLITGRFADAEGIILSYARTLKHGLIPNLLNGGDSRYNCRDAIWWWLYSIREYCKIAPNGHQILRKKVHRIHKPVASLPRKKSHETNGVSDMQQLCEIIQEAMECHFRGISFVEANAGKQLDEHMTMDGFTVEIGVNRETGFVFGGNEWNCGTWMDKMGSSEKAGNKGKPASPRDGSAVEIVGLSMAVVTWLDEVYKTGRYYPYDGVESLYDNTITLKWTWKKWAQTIKSNFERHFYIPLPDETPLSDDPNPKLINRRGIYKDTLGASHQWQDYQLRPNLLIAMVVAPELFEPERARKVLQIVKKSLVGPLGIRTLDPSDWNYNGDYDNNDQSCNMKTAHGFNYHQGPEWLWLTGYYIRASSKFMGPKERAHHLTLLANLYDHLVKSPWLGLPELTNSNGSECKDSCPIQAWSIGTILEALHESDK